MNLSIHKARGQCCDGCSTMSEAKTGVATQMKKSETRCLYRHYYGHSLNLACAHCIRRVKNNQKEALDTTYEKELVKNPLKRDAKLQQIKEELQYETSESSPGIRLLCPTRWTVLASAMHSIEENYPALKELWTWSLDNCSDTETKARIRGVDYHMMTFDFFHGLALGEFLLRHTDSLSTTLQRPNLSAAEGIRLHPRL